MLKRSYLFKKFLIPFLSMLCVIIMIEVFPQTKAQETKEDKCIKFFETQGKIFDDLQKTFSECTETPIAERFVPHQQDKFGIIGLDGEWARLDAFANILYNDPELKAFIVIYGGKINKYGELKERPKPLVHYLINNRGIDLKRIKIIEGGFREKFEFELWTSHSEKMYPPLSATVEPEKVVFRGKMKPLPVDF